MFSLRNLIFALIAFLLGIPGLRLVFSDLGSDELWTSRVLIAVVFFFLSGAGIGYFDPKFWLISSLTAWGGILLGAFIVLSALRKHGSSAFDASEPPYISAGLILMIIPLMAALIGGYIGRVLGGTRRELV